MSKVVSPLQKKNKWEHDDSLLALLNTWESFSEFLSPQRETTEADVQVSVATETPLPRCQQLIFICYFLYLKSKSTLQCFNLYIFLQTAISPSIL